MLASLSNKSRMTGRLIVMLTAISAAGCSEPEIDRAGTWKPANINDQNLRAMLVNPRDIDGGTGSITSRGDVGSRAVTRLLTDRRRALLDASLSHVAPASAAPADSGPAPVPSGGGGGGGGTSGATQ